ncbi:hypothetical protein [Nitrosopumilus sp.]|uniref:hypothetical protein n=1 Tax=Nitrosopumilus sp. TaxID=2024843 RepID=UPI0034A07915
MTSISFTNEDARKLMLDQVDFKMCLAKHFLLKIPSQVSLDFDIQHTKLESNVESFLFFSNSTIENLAFKINLFFEQPITSSKYVTKTVESTSSPIKNTVGVNRSGLWFDDITIYKLRNKLDSSVDEQNKVIQIINKYFSNPVEQTSQFDFTNSSLFLLRELRNFIAHNPIINRHAVRGTETKTSLLFRIIFQKYSPEQPQKNVPEVIGTKIAFIEDNPNQFFNELYSKLDQFIDEIVSIVQYPHKTSYHKTISNSELESLLS